MKPIQNILVPVDFTESSLAVLRHAIQLAKPFDAKVIVFHAYSRPVIHRNFEKRFDFSIVDSLEKFKIWKLERKINAKFKHLLNLVPELTEVRHDFVKGLGTIVSQVVKTAESMHADMILMGTGGAKGFDEFWGSKAAKISMRTKIPVLIMPKRSVLSKSGKIAFAYDFNKIKNLDELNIIKLFSLVYDSEVHILNISESDAIPKGKQQHEIDKLKEFFKDHKYSVHVKVHKDVEDGIIEYINHNNISMLVVLHRSRNFFENLFHDSLAEKLAQHASIPVLALEA